MDAQPDTSDLIPGHPAIWIHTMRGGYGYIEYIPCIIEEVKGIRVQIRFSKKDGKTIWRWVNVENVTGKGIKA